MFYFCLFVASTPPPYRSPPPSLLSEGSRGRRWGGGGGGGVPSSQRVRLGALHPSAALPTPAFRGSCKLHKDNPSGFYSFFPLKHCPVLPPPPLPLNSSWWRCKQSCLVTTLWGYNWPKRREGLERPLLVWKG